MKQLIIILLTTLLFINCTSISEDWYNESTELYTKYGDYMNSIIFKEVTEKDMSLFRMSGYSSETLFVHYFMTSIGYAQVIKHSPKLIDRYLPGMEKALELMTTEEAMFFDTESWEGNALEDFRQGKKDTHGSFMFYYNFAIGLHALLVPESKYATLHDSISNFLIERLDDTEFKIVETFPGYYWPADMSVAYGSLGIYQMNHKDKKFSQLYELPENFMINFCDSTTGLVYHNIELNVDNTLYKNLVRGSSSAYSAFFLAYLDENISINIMHSIRKELYDNTLLYTGVRENLRNTENTEDFNSGPIIKGLGVVASGFTLGTAKILGFKEMFKELYSTAALVGGSTKNNKYFKFKRGTHIGNSIMFTILTSGKFTAKTRNWDEGKHLQNNRENTAMKKAMLTEIKSWF